MRRTTLWRAAVAVLVAGVAVLNLSASAAQANPVKVSIFKNYGSAYCLDGYLSKGPYMNKSCNGGRFQQWVWNSTPGIRTPIRSVGETTDGKRWCLSGYGTSVYFSECQSPVPVWQQWMVNYPAGGGIPFIKHPTSGRCLAHIGPYPELQFIGLQECWNDYPWVRWVRIDVG